MGIWGGGGAQIFFQPTLMEIFFFFTGARAPPSHYVASPLTRSGTLNHMGDNLISWGCKKQVTVARSSTEAKYKALANSVAEVMWLPALLFELGAPVSKAPILWCDNIGATYLSINPIFHACTKQVEIDFHFVWDMVVDGSLIIRFWSSWDKLANIFTKPLSLSRFALLWSNLNVIPIQLSLRERVKDKSQLIESKSSSICEK